VFRKLEPRRSSTRHARLVLAFRVPAISVKTTALCCRPPVSIRIATRRVTHVLVTQPSWRSGSPPLSDTFVFVHLLFFGSLQPNRFVVHFLVPTIRFPADLSPCDLSPARSPTARVPPVRSITQCEPSHIREVRREIRNCKCHVSVVQVQITSIQPPTTARTHAVSSTVGSNRWQYSCHHPARSRRSR